MLRSKQNYHRRRFEAEVLVKNREPVSYMLNMSFKNCSLQNVRVFKALEVTEYLHGGNRYITKLESKDLILVLSLQKVASILVSIFTIHLVLQIYYRTIMLRSLTTGYCWNRLLHYGLY